MANRETDSETPSPPLNLRRNSSLKRMTPPGHGEEEAETEDLSSDIDLTWSTEIESFSASLAGKRSRSVPSMSRLEVSVTRQYKLTHPSQGPTHPFFPFNPHLLERSLPVSLCSSSCSLPRCSTSLFCHEVLPYSCPLPRCDGRPIGAGCSSPTLQPLLP